LGKLYSYFFAKEIMLGVIFNPGVKAVNRHGVHGSTPCWSNQLRMLATAVERRVGGELTRCPKV
jgi:hypothetical protein